MSNVPEGSRNVREEDAFDVAAILITLAPRMDDEVLAMSVKPARCRSLRIRSSAGKPR